MSRLPQILESKTKIRFHDCDPFNHLNNSRYLDYMMAARGDQLIEHYQFDIYKFAQTEAVGWVSAQTQISYHAPALVMEQVVIQTRLLAFSERSLTVESIMWDIDKVVLKALMWTKLVHYDLRKKASRPHDQHLLDFFQQVVAPLPQHISFQERATAIRQEKTYNQEI